MKLTKALLIAGITTLSLATLPAPALADDPIVRAADAERAAFEADRQAILSMAGDYAVVFDMQESTAWMEGYQPLDRKISSGYESVRVIEDTGTKIVLQHLLVVGSPSKPMVIKHWRQDWHYEPEAVLAYTGKDTWKMTAVPEALRAGRWSQTVYQVDDSPRYAGWGQWEVTNGVKRWRSNWTARPLARRDAIRDPIYDHYIGINRHQITPRGWIHWQDNTKMKPVEGSDGSEPVVQEYVLNSYERFDGYNIAAADAYWTATADYWAAVRAKWDAVRDAHGGIVIEEEAETGTVISARLLAIANEVQAGALTTEAAIAEASRLIAENTRAL